MMLIVKTVGPQPGEVAPGWLVSLAAAVNFFHIYAVPLLLGQIIAGVATRQRMRSLWPLIGLAAICLVASSNYLHVDVPLAPGQHGESSLGANAGPWTAFRAAINLALTLPLYLALQRWRTAFAR